MSSSSNEPGFSKLRAFFWPIHDYELKKFIPMLSIFFLISFNYSVLRNMKDTLVVTAAGAEIIPFLKFACVIPMAIVFMVFYAKLSNILNTEKLFYAAIAPFLIFFVAFALFLYPYRDLLQPTDLVAYLQNMLPQNDAIKGLLSILTHWTFALFYVMAELWGSVALSLLFWGFANQITKVNEAKRFYALFGLGANIALIAAGPVIKFIADLGKNTPAGVDSFKIAINFLMGTATVATVLILAIYYWMNRKVLTDSRFYSPEEVQTKKKKAKMSLMQSFKYLAQSKYLTCIAILVFAYGMAIVLIEVTWKSQLKLQFPNSNEYLKFMANYSMATGFTTVFLLLFVSGQVIRKLGWGFAALITPVILLISGTGFFTFIIFKDTFEPLLQNYGFTALAVAVAFGTVQNVISKAAKYSLFDPTKEMTYIPLDKESKVKGKAAIDVVGARLGKAGGSITQIILIALIGPLQVVTPYIAGILLLIILAWIGAAKSLSKQFAAKQEENK